MNKIKVKNYDQLYELIKEEIKKHGNSCDLNFIDVSEVEDMSGLFCSENRSFNGDISNWDVSHVINMECMFSYSQFNGDISRWNTGKVEDMASMFENSQFNGDISKWDTSNVWTMAFMFENSIFNGNISRWNVEKVENMICIFYNAQFTQDLSDWKPYLLESHSQNFSNAKITLPYWNSYERLDERKTAIDNYHAKKELMKKLKKDLKFSTQSVSGLKV